MQIKEDGEYKKGSLELAVKQLTGGGIAFDWRQRLYIDKSFTPILGTLGGIGKRNESKREERIRVLDELDRKETEGTAALAIGRAEDDRDCIDVTTSCGLINPTSEDEERSL